MDCELTRTEEAFSACIFMSLPGFSRVLCISMKQSWAFPVRSVHGWLGCQADTWESWMGAYGPGWYSVKAHFCSRSWIPLLQGVLPVCKLLKKQQLANVLLQGTEYAWSWRKEESLSAKKGVLSSVLLEEWGMRNNCLSSLLLVCLGHYVFVGSEEMFSWEIVFISLWSLGPSQVFSICNLTFLCKHCQDRCSLRRPNLEHGFASVVFMVNWRKNKKQLGNLDLWMGWAAKSMTTGWG